MTGLTAAWVQPVKSIRATRIAGALGAVVFSFFSSLSHAWEPLPPVLEAAVSPVVAGVRSWALMEVETETVLNARNADQPFPAASLSKLMTSYLVANALESGQTALDRKVRVSEKAWLAKGSRMFAQAGAYISVEDLIRGLVVHSGNDAAIALAEHLAGSEEAFAQHMSVTARRLGLKNSRFVNATGLDERERTNVMSARDIVLLLKQLIVDFPDFYQKFLTDLY